jgi:hypothetical protein
MSISHKFEFEPVQTGLFDAADDAMTGPEVGTFVSLQERAEHLTHALNQLSHASQLMGMVSAAQTPHQAEHAIRYQQALPKVLSAAVKKRVAYTEDARFQFMFGAGYIGLKHSGLLSTEDATNMADLDFIDFCSRFAGSAHRTDRNEFKKILEVSKG